MSCSGDQCGGGKISSAVKNDKKLNRYSENEKIILYELFERYQEIIDIKLRRSLYSSTKQCEVRECWELILKTFNEHQQTSERTMKQLQKFWLNAKLRRMFPYDKCQAQTNSRRTSNDSKPQIKRDKQSPVHSSQSIDNGDTDFQQQELELKQVSESDTKPTIFNIKYVVPSNLNIQEHQSQQTNEETLNYQNSSKDECLAANSNPVDECEQDDRMQDERMQDDSDEAIEEVEHSQSMSNQQKIENLRLQEMENRVCESQLRCDVQKLIITKAEEEFRHMQAMNKIRLQEAKIRLKLLERNCSNSRANIELFEGI